jgi:beta-exotoxin I transport system permease protein
MIGRLFFKTLRDSRKSLFWWSVGVVGFVAFALAFYPAIKSEPSLNQIYAQSKALQAFAGTADITSPAGYLTREVYAITGPIVLIVYGIILGTGLVAGEEGRKTLPLLLAQPVSRVRVIWDKFAAMKVALLLVAVLTFVSIAVFAPLFQLDGLDYGKMAVATGMMFLVGLAFGAIGFLIGAATGNRGLAGGVAGALAFAMYILNTLSGLVESLEPYKWSSLFYYLDANNALVQYPKWWYALVLGGVSVACFLASLAVFRRRDIHA